MASYEYPHLNPERAQTLKEIKATPEQYRSSDISAKKGINQSLQNYRYNGKSLVFLVIGATGSGKSATANTILGRKVFEEGSSAVSVTTQVQEHSTDVDGFSLTVVDTPSSWHTKLDTLIVDIFILVINLASPRFGQAQLDELRSLNGPDGSPLLKSGRCVVVLPHADSALQQVSLREYLTEIEGDPLHTLLTKDLQGRIIAVNNAAFTQYERHANQRAILYLALQAKGGVPSGYGTFKRNMMGGMVVLTVSLLLCSMLFEWPLLPYMRNMYNLGVAWMGLIAGSIPKWYMIGSTVTLTVAILLGSMLYGWPPFPHLRNKHTVGVRWIGLKSAALLAFLSRGRRPMHIACAIGALSVTAGFLYIAKLI